MKNPDAVSALSALAHESRLAVFRMLVQSGPDGRAAGELVEALAIPGPTLSFHLKGLSQAGLVASRRRGRHVFYTANFPRMNSLLDYLTENCCGSGASCAPACAPDVSSAQPRRIA
jgi:DNA-binding transcriptional ArsR family regulator